MSTAVASLKSVLAASPGVAAGSKPAMSMANSRKQAISLRIAAADLRKVKKLAERLGARDSDVIRFALKMMLARLGPLYQDVRGRALVPVIVDAGRNLLHHFDLDFARLEEIVNAGV